MLLKKILLLGVAGLCAAANGQSRNELPDRPYLSLHEQSAWLLNYRSVQNGLGLSADEKSGLAKALQDYSVEEARVLSPSRTASDQDFEQLDHFFAKTALAPISAPHRHRLMEILLQVKGVEAMEDPEVAKEVGLTSSQVERLHSMVDAANQREEDFDADLAQRIIKLPRIAPSSLYEKKKQDVIDAAAPERTALEQQRERDERKALSGLSPAQKKRWESLQGAPFLMTRFQK
jgi:hypothetical protein